MQMDSTLDGGFEACASKIEMLKTLLDLYRNVEDVNEIMEEYITSTSPCTDYTAASLSLWRNLNDLVFNECIP